MPLSYRTKATAMFIALSGLLSMGIIGSHLYPHRVPLIWYIPYFSFEIHLQSTAKATKGMNEIRSLCRTRYRVISSYRSKQKNNDVGGAKNSQHTKGKAFDVVVPMKMRDDFYQCAKKSHFTSFGWGNNTVHIDMGPRRWWTYNDQGQHVSGEEKYKYLHKAPLSFKKDFGLPK
jgi:hypothetical protein